MPAPAAAAFISVYLDKLATTIAKSATFRTVTGTASEAAAKAKVAQFGNAVSRPRALVNYGEKFRLRHGTTSSRDVAGYLEILFEWDVPAAYVPDTEGEPFDLDGAIVDYRNKVGAIIEEMHALTRLTDFTDGCLAIVEFEMAGEDFFVDETDATNYVCGLVKILVAGQ